MTSAEPKYLALAARLRAITNEQPVGTPVLSERDLAAEEGVSRMTARKAIEQLVAEGRLTREVGRGTFVARPELTLPLTLNSFTVQVRQRGLTPSARVVEATLVSAGDLAETFNVSEHEPLARLVRVRLTDGAPVAVESAHILAAAAPDLLDAADFATASLYAVLDEQYGVRFDAGTQVIRAGLVPQGEAELLEVAQGSPVLQFLRTSTLNGRVLEHTLSSYPADRFVLQAAITPTRAPGSAPLIEQ